MNNNKTNSKIRINPEKIPKDVVKKLALSFLKGIREYYSNPDNVRKFKEWQEKRHKEQYISN